MDIGELTAITESAADKFGGQAADYVDGLYNIVSAGATTTDEARRKLLKEGDK